MGRFHEALADLAPLIEHFPQDPALFELRGQVHDRLGQREQAQADMKRAVESPLLDAQHYNNGHGGWPLGRSPCAIPGRRWPWPGRPSRSRRASPSTSTRWASPCIARWPVCRGHRHLGEEPRGQQRWIRRLRPVLPRHGPPKAGPRTGGPCLFRPRRALAARTPEPGFCRMVRRTSTLFPRRGRAGFSECPR